MEILYKIIKSKLLCFLLLSFMIYAEADAQISISRSSSGNAVACNDCCEGDCTDGDRGDYCSDIEWSHGNGDVIYCPTRVRSEADAWDSDGIGCGFPFDCNVIQWSTGYVLKPGSINSGTLTHNMNNYPNPSSGCSQQYNYVITGSGTWPNNVLSTTGEGAIANNSCTSSIAASTATSGNIIPGVGWLTLDCQGDAWYVYNLTTANLTYIAFTGEKINGFLTAYTDIPEVRYNSTNSCTGACTLSDAGITGDFSVGAPKTGYYFIRINENLGNIERARINHGRGGTLPNGDVFCNAIDLGTLDPGDTFNGSGNNGAFSKESGCSLSEPGGQDNTVWYKFTIGSTPGPVFSVDVDASGVCTPWMKTYRQTSTPSCPFTYTSNGFTAITEVMDGGIDGYEELFCPTAGQVYYVQVDITGLCSTGDFSVQVKMPNSTKAADECVDALNIGSGTLNGGATLGNMSTISYSNLCATASAQTDPWSIGGVDNDVWFKFTTAADAGRNVTIDVSNDPLNLGDQMDLQLALYEGCPNTGPLIDSEYDLGFLSETMNVTCLKPSTTYHVRVDGDAFGVLLGNGNKGHFGIQVKDNGPYPANDLVCGATTIPVQTIYTYNSASLTNQTNVKGTNCFEPNPDWTFETGQDNDHAVWYYIGQIPGRTMVVDANNLSGDDIDIQMALYSSTVAKGLCTTPASTPALTEVQKEYAGAGVVWDEDAYFNCLNPSLYYWLMVDGSAGATSLITSLEEGTFSLRVWFPEEGETTWCNAENIGTVPNGGNVTKLNLANKCGVSTGKFGTAGTFTLPSGFTLDNAVVYRFTTPNSGSVKIEASNNPYYPGQMGLLTGDEVDLQLAVFEKQGAVCSTANYFPKGNNYDITDGFSETLIVNCLNANTEYYLLVDGSGLNASGYYDVKISDYGKTTTNDFLCNAKPIGKTYTSTWAACNYGSNASDTAKINNENNYCATITNDLPSSLGGIPPAWDNATSGVWYTFKAPKSGKVKIEVINSLPDAIPPFDEPEISAQIAVFRLPGGYQGNCTNLSTEKDRLQYIASDYTTLLHDEEITVECLMPDSVYHLLIDGTYEFACPSCDRGEFYVVITPDPRDRPSTNDLPCNAIDLGTPQLPSVWTNPTVYDTRVAPASNAATYASPTTGYPGNTGLYSHVRSSPSNPPGTCMRAENNFCASISGEPAISGGNFFTDFGPDATVWYKFTAPSTGEVKINTYSDPDNRGDGILTQIAVFETSDNTCTGTMVGIAADGIPDILTGNNELTVKCLDPGKTYFLMVDGSGLNKRGYFELQIQAVPATQTGPANNAICNATPVTYPGAIGSTTTLNNQTNRCATIQSGVYPDPTTFSTDADVWYTFTTPNTAAPHAVEVTVTSGLPWPFGDAMDPQVALYKRIGTCPSATFELVDDQYSAVGLPFFERMEFHCLEQNTTYYLMVDGSGLNEQGNFTLDVERITPHPLAGNDNICNVTSLATGSLGTLGSVTGNKVGNTTTNWHNFCSTVETNEATLMTDGNYSLDQTVWFKFRTPNVANNVDVEIRALNDPNNIGDQIDLQMLLVQGNPTCPFSTSTFSTLSPIESVDPLLTFSATMNVCLPPNTDFYIQVDGSGLNTQGYFTLEVENKGTASAPANDNICNAKVLPSGGTITGAYTGYLNDNNNCATLEANEKQQSAGSVQRSVWYKFVAPTSADVSIEVKGNSAIPFTQYYFLPDVTIWEVNDGTSTIPGCPTPSAANWNKLDYNDYQGIPNSLANGFFPTVVLTPLCLKPGYTYYVQVDGINGIGLDGFFDIRIKNNQPSYTGPSNNFCAGAETLTVGPKSCQISGGTWASKNYGDPTWSKAPGGCSDNCGDIWYKFTMPAACGNNTQSFVKIEGNDELGTLGITNSDMAIAAYRGSCASLTYIKCSTGGLGNDPDFSLSGTPGETIYLQVWDMNGDDHNENFQICISEQKSADECIDATTMQLDVPYCFSVASQGPETPSSAVPGSGLLSYCGSGNPQHSTYFKFTTDLTNTFCDDYYMYIDLPGLAKEIAGSSLQNCLAGTSPSVEFTATIWEVVSGGSLCTPGAANITQRDCYTFNDCGTGSFGSNVSGPHGNGGVVNDTVWFNLGTGFAFQPNKTYYIVLDYRVLNPLQFNNRTILDGTIEIGRRCKGRVWEYSTASLVTTDKYCESRDGWQHYYDDKGTTSTADDKYVFSVFPNGNNIKGTAKVYKNGTHYSYPAPSIGYAEYVMSRRWDFVMTSGFNTINPAKPVKVRFYYQTAEKQAIIDAATTFRNAYGGYYEDFEWFKSANGHEFNVVTDVNPKVISVGPNGYSETGCLSYWDANGVYIGSPGVTRCSTVATVDWEDNNLYQSCNGIHYVEYSGLTGFSGGTGGTGVSPWDVSPLPVELVSFTGYNDGNKNVLNWVTASEINTHKFLIERSEDGILFDVIGEKAAAGNSIQVLNYSLDDIAPYAGNNYYRLKVIDLDSTYNYSGIILIKTDAAQLSYSDAILNVFPNPTNHTLFIDYVSSEKGEVSIKVFDALGKSVLQNSTETVKGNQRLWIDVRDLANGVYILNIQNKEGGNILQTKFVKE
jgi:hypothetical protein